jgi:predicted HTH transcriptional regulator
MTEIELKSLIKELVSYSQETEWLEFKLNFHFNEEIGERLSALANGAYLN